MLHGVTALAQDLAQNGCEGRDVGALFVIGDATQVLKRSYPLILNPLSGHDPVATNVTSPAMQNTLRELAQLDGAFVITRNGIVLSAARCLDVNTQDLDLPAGLGSRHVAAASITSETDALAIVLSQSSPTVRMFFDGQVVDELHVAPRSHSREAPARSRPIEQRPYTPLAPRKQATVRTRHSLFPLNA